MKTNREEFEKLLNQSKETNVFLDDFEKDAIDGWSNSGIDFKVAMSNLDKKQFGSAWLRYLILGCSILLLFSIGAIFKMQKSEVQSSNRKDIHKTIRKSVNTEEKPSLSNVKEPQTLKTKIITDKNTIELETTPLKNENVDVVEINLSPLPKKEITGIQKSQGRRINKAIELYLADFAVIDYRYYRNKKQNEIIPDYISGTPANFESKDQLLENDFSNGLKKAYLSFLDKTMHHLKSKEFKIAISRFTQILENYPDDANALFYSAFASYALKDFNKVLSLLEQLNAVSFTNFEEEAEWLKLKTYKELGRNDEFQQLRQIIINRNGFYSKQAEIIRSEE